MSNVDNIKDKLGIADVVGSYIKLEKAGINFKALCPFHHEKTPSFSISPSRGSFYCFGCGEKGDIFTFVQKFEGVDFQGALKILAERAGVPITFEPAESKDKKNILYLILEESTSYFEDNLKENNEALHYLKERGLKDNTIKDFRLGYTLPDWRGLFKHLKNKGFEESLIEDAGLIKRNPEGKESYDRFRGRIMFPIADPSGRIIAFSGRIFDGPSTALGTGSKDIEPAKYINSPETPLFSKSKTLYGYDKAKDGIRKLGFTVLVEGQMDLLMSHQAGFKNTVALSGTALTDEHVSLLNRLSSKLVLGLDSDEAGMKASGKSAALTLSKGMDVKVARIPSGSDPADIIKVDPEIWKKAIKEAVHIIDFYMDIISAAKYEERKFRQEVSRQVLPYVARIKNSIDRAHFISTIAEKLRLPENAIIEEISTIIKNNLSNNVVKNEEQSVKEDKIISSSQSRADMFLDRIFALFNAEIKLKEGKISTSIIEEKLKEILGEEVFLKKEKDARMASNVLFEGEELYQQSGQDLEEEMGELLLNLKSHILKKKLDEKTRELKEKEKSGDTEEAINILKICHELAREIAKIDYSLKK